MWVTSITGIPPITPLSGPETHTLSPTYAPKSVDIAYEDALVVGDPRVEETVGGAVVGQEGHLLVA